HLHLPSFPTRRSSDLLSSPLPPHMSAAGARVGSHSALPSGVSLTTGWGWPHRSGSHTGGVSPAVRVAAGEMLQGGKDRCSITLRSEEHTSELQSRFDL